MTKWHQGQLVKLYEGIKASGAEGLTHSAAAKELGVTKSVYVRNLLDELVAGGYVVKVWNDNLKRPAWTWKLPEGQ